MPPDHAPNRLDELVRSPFARLTQLLEGLAPGLPAIDLSLGEPKALIPAFLGPTLDAHLAEFGRYPPIKGIPALRQAIAAWLGRRYPLLDGRIDAETQVLPLNGSREGLFSAIFPALARKPGVERPAVLIPNPFYQAYAAAAAASGAEPEFLPSLAETDFLPELELIDEALLKRTVAFYLCTPSNPQGAVADRAYLARAIALARRFDFLLFADECYSEIYSETPPPGAARDGLCRNREPRQCRVVPVAVEAFRAAGLKIGVRGRRSRVHRVLPPLPQRGLPASAAARAARLGRGLG